MNLGFHWEVFASCLIVSGGEGAHEREWLVRALYEDEERQGCVR